MMNTKRTRRVLIVDDLERWRRILSRVLERHDFSVDVAATMDEARQHLGQQFYHLLVLDIRMKDDEEENIEGLDFLQEFRPIHKDKYRERIIAPTGVLMISAYGTVEYAIKAFGSKVDDFIDKMHEDFNDLFFLRTVESIFKDMRINLDLQIYWEGGLESAADAMHNVRIGGRRIKRGQEPHALLTEELDDLMCRLFHRADSIIVNPLTSGYSGAGVLRVLPFFKETGQAQVAVVKFGDSKDIEQEYDNFNEFVSNFVGNRTQAETYFATPRLGGVVYTFVGTEVDATDDFETFYREAGQAEIEDVLSRLVSNTCGTWYRNREQPGPYDLGREYRELLRLDESSLDGIRQERLRTIQGKAELKFSTLSTDESFPNPMLATAGQHFVRSVIRCVTHGDFNAQNIRVDATGNSWLIDFERTGKGHILRDLARLDTVVRTQLLGADEATLQERWEMEKTLAGVERFSQLGTLSTTFPNPAVEKAFATSLHLRRLAAQVIGVAGNDDIEEFFLPCLFYGMNTVRYHSLPKVQREHGMLSACVLAHRLGL